MAEPLTPTLAHPNSSISKTSPAEYCSKLLERINKYRKTEYSKSLCDCTLETDDGKRFPIHRVVLGACCEYFDTMFTGDLKESNEDQVKMHQVDSTGLEAVISFAYSGKVESLTLNTFEATMETAMYLGVEQMVAACVAFCEKLRVTLENFLDMYRISGHFSIRHKYQEVRRLVLDNFDNLVASEGSCALSFNQLEELLAENSLNIKSEYELFEWVVKWSQYDYEINRKEKAVDLMQTVRFPLMSAEELEKVRAVEMMTSNEECLKLLNEARTYQENQNEQPKLQSIRTQTRSGKPCLHVILAHDTNRISCIDTTTGEVKANFSDSAFNDPQATLNEMCVGSVAGNFLYVYRMRSDIEYFSRCDLLLNRWYPLSPRKQTGRVNCLLISFHDAVYAIGGRDERTKQALSSVERYSIQDDVWTECSPLPVADSCLHSGVVCSGRIFISGGMENDRSGATTVLSYDPVADTWRREPSLNSARMHHSMFEFKGRIYVAGGFEAESLARSRKLRLTIPVETVEMFTPSAESSGTWTVCETKINLYSAFTVVEKEEVYFLMGRVIDLFHPTDRKSKSVMVFSPEDDRLIPYEESSLKFPVDELLQWKYPRGCWKFTFPGRHMFITGDSL